MTDRTLGQLKREDLSLAQSADQAARERTIDRSERDTTVVGVAVVSRSRSQRTGDRSERDNTVVHAAVASLSE